VDRDQLKGRVFEIMMSGALLLESANEQIACYFEDGVDYVSFTTKEDLLDKIHYFLEHPDERLKIAENGRNKCIEKYTPQIFFDNILKITELKEGI